MTFKEAIKEEIKKTYILAGEQPPEAGTFEFIVTTWAGDLKDIPQHELEKAFKKARLHNKRYKILRAHQVIEAYQQMPKTNLFNIQEELEHATVEQIIEIAKKYPEFAPIFKSINLNSDELPETEWKNEFNRLCRERFGWRIPV